MPVTPVVAKTSTPDATNGVPIALFRVDAGAGPADAQAIVAVDPATGLPPVGGLPVAIQNLANPLPISAASLPLPAGASTEATLALIKAKTDNLDVALSTRTKPADIQGAKITDGTNTVAIAPANTMADATMPAAVVTMAPNTQPLSVKQGGPFTVTTTPPANASTNVAQVGGVAVVAGPKGTQQTNAIPTQDMKDSGRVNIAWTAEVAGAATTEGLLTVTESRDGAATTTSTTKVVTNGKRLRITGVTIAVESLGSGTAPQRAYLRMRFNTAGAVVVASPIQATWECANNPAVVKTATSFSFAIPDGIEFLGDGTKQIGFTIQFPDWVTTTATVQAKITITAFEY